VIGISLQKKPAVIDRYSWKAACATAAHFSWDMLGVNCTSKNSAMDNNCIYWNSIVIEIIKP